MSCCACLHQLFSISIEPVQTDCILLTAAGKLPRFFMSAKPVDVNLIEIPETKPEKATLWVRYHRMHFLITDNK